MNRKDFIKNVGFTCVGGTVAVALLQSCTSTNYFAQNVIADNQIIVKKAEFVNVEKGKTLQRKYVLVKNDRYNFPIYICKINEESYVALLMQCTHKGCELKPNGDHLSCPCHGSEFSNKGVVQNPPADENLKIFHLITDNENIYIQL